MHPTPRLAAALLAGSGLGWPLLAQADLVEDSHASLELRNFWCRDAVGVQQAEHVLVRPRVLGEGHYPLPRQVCQRGVVAVVDRAGGDDPAQRVAAQFQVEHRLVAQRIGLEDQVQVALLQLLGEVARGVRHQLDLHRREGFRDPGHQRAQPSVDDRVHGADADPSLGAGAGVERLLQRVHGVHHALGVGQYLVAFRGQGHAARVADEQLHAEFVLQHGDPAGNGSLGAEQLLRGEAEALQARDPDEGLEEFQVHVAGTDGQGTQGGRSEQLPCLRPPSGGT